MFPQWLKETTKEIKTVIAQLAPSRFDVGVALYCNAGKHRSVALSIVLSVHLPTMGISIAEAPQHLAREKWLGERHFCQGDCPDCMSATATAARLLAIG